MVIERYNSEHADSGWKPPQDRAAAFEQPQEAGPSKPDAKPDNKPEGKKERKKRKAGQASDNPLFAEAPTPKETKRQPETVPPLLGEGVIWQSDETLKHDTEDEKTLVDSTAGPQLTAEQMFQMQQELQASLTSEAVDDTDLRKASTDPAVGSRFQPQPQMQHQARMEDGPQDDHESDVAHQTSAQESETPGPEASPMVADAEAEPEPGYVYTAAEEAPDSPPPVLPPDPAMYERRAMMDDAPVVREAPAAVPVVTKYESDIPPGMQRSTADVSRAAWTGALAGWWMGRRGKNKAVKAAHEAGKAEGLAEAGHKLEAEPLHYPSAETDRRTVMPVSVEVKPVAKTEVATVVAASVAALEKLRPHTTAEAPKIAMAAAKRVAERSIVRPETGREAPAAVTNGVEKDMSRRELLKVAKDIKVEGVSLKEIFGAQRIDEEGLRAVVREYLRGGDVRGRLSREITAKEMSFEHDPMFRHGKRGEWLDRAGAALERSGERIGKAVNKGLDVTRELAGDRGAQLAASTSRTAHKAGQLMSSGAKQAQHDLIDTSHTADWIGVTAVVVVWSAILLLMLW